MRQLNDTDARREYSAPRWNVVLRALRESAGLNQEHWAARVGYGRRTIQRWEQGQHPPDAEAVEALIRTCSELRLFEGHRAGVLATQKLTADSFRSLLGDARVEPSPGLLDAQLLGSAHSLPLDLTSFVGRRQELADIVELVKSTRLVTLTGPGGVGKTRLALEVASELVDWYADGVSVVDLAPIAEHGLVASAIARTLGVRENTDLTLRDSLVLYLRSRRHLLVLDNFEHLLEAAPLVSELVHACRELGVLATSREPLRLRQEHQFRVAPLNVPPGDDTRTFAAIRDSAAVELFAQRAAQVVPEFSVTPANAGLIADICLRLDGLPLAIELAAPRLKVLSVADLLERLEHRLPLLVGGARDLPVRQRTLRATLAWSYDLLQPVEQRLFRQLALFTGGCTFHAAETVCELDQDGDRLVLDILTSLVDKNLLQPSGSHLDEPRFTMLETIREFALEHLVVQSEYVSLCERYLEYFLKLSDEAEVALLSGHGQVAALERLEREHDNLRTAIRLAAESGSSDHELRLAGALAYFWIMRGYFAEGLARLRSALTRSPSASPGRRAKALTYVAYFTKEQGDRACAEKLLEEAFTLANFSGDLTLQALVLINRAFIARAEGRNFEDLELVETAIRLAQSADITLPGILRYQRASALLRLGNIDRALELHAETLLDAQRAGDAYTAAAVMLDLGFAALVRADQDKAVACWREAVRFAGTLGEPLIGELSLEALAVVEGMAGRPEQAAILLGAAERLCQRTGMPAPGAPGTELRLPMPGGLSVASIISDARRSLGDEEFTAAWRTGARAPLEEVIAQTAGP